MKGSLVNILRYQESNKFVLSVDHVDDGRKSLTNRLRKSQYMKRCTEQNFHCFAAKTDRELTTLHE